MRKLNLREAQNLELNILVKVSRICEDNNYNYSLAAGTMLGAIRHKGFIPWDDDIDIVMPRVDYDRLVEYFINNNTGKYKLENIYTDTNYGYMFSKIYDSDTTIYDPVLGKYNIGLHIDVFPIDGLGKNLFKAKIIVAYMYFMNKLLVASNWTTYSRSKTHSIIYEPLRLFMYIISRNINSNKLAKNLEDKISRNLSKKYVGCLCGAYGQNEIFEQCIYHDYIYVEFEGKKFKGIKEYDKYLKQYYGDYMKLPPKEKQKTHHTFESYIK